MPGVKVVLDGAVIDVLVAIFLEWKGLDVSGSSGHVADSMRKEG